MTSRTVLVTGGTGFVAGWCIVELLRQGYRVRITVRSMSREPALRGSAHGSMADPMGGSINLMANVLHLPFAPQLAMGAALLETFGGLAVAIGLATRLFAPMLAIQMAFICLALGPTYPWIDRGFEYPLILGSVALLISIHGGGAYSADRLIGREL